MVEFVAGVYLTLMFISLYLFSFFVVITLKNKRDFFAYPKSKKKYSVTLIIPAHNEEGSIAETIENVLMNDYPKEFLEIIVVNDRSIDKTKQIVEKLCKKYPELKLLNRTEKSSDKVLNGKSDAINAALAIAKGELIAVTDADSFPDVDSLKKIVGYFDKPNMAAVTSFVKVRNKEGNLYGKVQALEYTVLAWNRKILDFVDSVYVTNGPLSVYRKKFLLEIGGFDVTTITEDIDVTWNLMSKGYQTSMCLDAKASTIVPTTFKKWFRQRVRWGIGGVQAIKKYKKSVTKGGMFGFFVIPFVFLSIFLSIVGFAFSAYLIIKSLSARILSTGYSIASDVSLIHFQEINLAPSVMIFFFVVLFFSSLFYYRYILTRTKFYDKLTIGRFLVLVFYMLVFLAFYPLIWYATFYRMAKKDYGW